jgi:hypothetical protein
MTDAEKCCLTCDHRSGAKCLRTGYHTDVEMMHGGRCAVGKASTELKLYTPRRPFLKRLFNIVPIKEQA